MSARSVSGRGAGIKAAGTSSADEVPSGNVGRDVEAGSEVWLSDVADDPRWYVVEYMKRYLDTVDCRHFKAIVAPGWILFIYD